MEMFTVKLNQRLLCITLASLLPKNFGDRFFSWFFCSIVAVGAPKPKKIEGGGSNNGKDSDSRASTPSKEIMKEDKTPTATVVNTSTSSSRGRSAKPTSSTPVPTEPGKEAVAVKTSAETPTVKDDATK